MKLKIIKNPNEKEYENITQRVIENNNYCPCLLERDEDTKCMCKDFREQDTIGFCHCHRFMKIAID